MPNPVRKAKNAPAQARTMLQTLSGEQIAKLSPEQIAALSSIPAPDAPASEVAVAKVEKPKLAHTFTRAPQACVLSDESPALAFGFDKAGNPAKPRMGAYRLLCAHLFPKNVERFLRAQYGADYDAYVAMASKLDQ
jgi:hypothetical protein